MNWQLKTTDYRADGIFSELWRHEAKFCVTLEHAFPSGDGYMPKLPRGATYTCKRGIHQLEHGGPFETFEITGVPGHSGILFHIGNFNSNSDGCALMGGTVVKSATWWINNSKDVFAGFMQALDGVDTFELEVS